VPLVPAMREVIGDRPADAEDSNLIFGRMGGQAMLLLFKKECPGYDVHRLRSTFSDWAGDQGYPAELREIALAHAVGDAVQQTYNKGGHKELRREMMAAWSKYATGDRS